MTSETKNSESMRQQVSGAENFLSQATHDSIRASGPRYNNPVRLQDTGAANSLSQATHVSIRVSGPRYNNTTDITSVDSTWR